MDVNCVPEVVSGIDWSKIWPALLGTILSVVVSGILFFIKNNIDKKHIAPCTNTQATILLKMSAFYDLKQRGDAKYKKHRRDILKLALLLTGNEEIILVGRMKEDFDTFLAHLKQDVDSRMLKSIVDKLPVKKEQIIEILQKVFRE